MTLNEFNQSIAESTEYAMFCLGRMLNSEIEQLRHELRASLELFSAFPGLCNQINKALGLCNAELAAREELKRQQEEKKSVQDFRDLEQLNLTLEEALYDGIFLQECASAAVKRTAYYFNGQIWCLFWKHFPVGGWQYQVEWSSTKELRKIGVKEFKQQYK